MKAPRAISATPSAARPAKQPRPALATRASRRAWGTPPSPSRQRASRGAIAGRIIATLIAIHLPRKPANPDDPFVEHAAPPIGESVQPPGMGNAAAASAPAAAS